MSLLNRNFKSDISSNDEIIKSACDKYFSIEDEYDVSIKDNSLTLNTKAYHISTDLDILVSVQNELPFLNTFNTNTSISLNIRDRADNHFVKPFNICTGKQIILTNALLSGDSADMSNTIIKCDTLKVFLEYINVTNITLRTKEIHTIVDANLKQLYCIKGDIKTDTLVVNINSPSCLDKLTNKYDQLREIFIRWFNKTWFWEWEDISLFREIDPIKLLKLEYYNATNYCFTHDRYVLIFSKDPRMKELRTTIEMANGWCATVNR